MEDTTQSLTPKVIPGDKAKHEESVRLYPSLNLSEGEYVISAVKRHWIGLVIPIGITVLLIAITMALSIIYPLLLESQRYYDYSGGEGEVFTIAVLLSLLFAIGGYVAVWVYADNRFFLTNESVIQEIRYSIFAKKEQTVSLASVEDASYSQKGILQTLFDYGSIRLSTQGSRTVYEFTYVTNPKGEIALLTDAIENFKDLRPDEQE